MLFLLSACQTAHEFGGPELSGTGCGPDIAPESAEGMVSLHGPRANQRGCVTCPSVEREIVLVGPSLQGIATPTEDRIPGVIAANHIYVSIVEPDYHLVEGYESASMLPGYQDSLSQDEITDLVSYLMTLTIE